MNRQEVLTLLLAALNQRVERLERNNSQETSDLNYCQDQNTEIKSELLFKRRNYR